MAARPSRPGTSTAPVPFLASPFQIAPVGIEPTNRSLPLPAAMPSGWNPLGNGMVAGALPPRSRLSLPDLAATAVGTSSAASSPRTTRWILPRENMARGYGRDVTSG